MGRALRTAAVFGVLSCVVAALVGACSGASNPPPSPGTDGEPSPGADADPRAVESGTGDSAVEGASDSADAADASRWAPAPPACPARTFLNEDVIARAAVAAGACFSDDGLPRITTYFRGVLGGYAYRGGDALITCLAAVTNGCDGVAACYGWSALQGQTCGTCVGATAVDCQEQSFKHLVTCDKYGGACDAGKCDYPRDPLCVGQSSFCNSVGGAVHCESDRSYLGADCKGLGTACTNPTVFNNEVACEGLGSTCTPSFPQSAYYELDPSPPNAGGSCKGDILEACVGKHSADLDCRCFGAGFSCRSALPDGGLAQTSFCGSASECEPRTFKRSCDGTTIVFCNAGKIARIDCSAMGFQSCGPLSSSSGQPKGCQPAPGWVLPN